MSLVMRVINRPAFSPVKKSSESRWRWENTRTRSSYMSRSPSTPVNRTRHALVSTDTTIEPT